MKEITVTMPLGDYEIMRNKVETLKSRDVRNYVVMEVVDLNKGIFGHRLDLNALFNDLKVDYPELYMQSTD